MVGLFGQCPGIRIQQQTPETLLVHAGAHQFLRTCVVRGPHDQSKPNEPLAQVMGSIGMLGCY